MISHVSVDMFCILATRTCQVFFIGSFVLQNISLLVLTVGNAPVGNVPFSPHGGGLPAKRQIIAIFTSLVSEMLQENIMTTIFQG